MLRPVESEKQGITKNYYDKNSNIIKVMNSSQSAEDVGAYDKVWNQVEYQYDNMNRPTVSISYPTLTTPEYIQNFYDNKGNISKVVKGQENIVTESAIPETCAVEIYNYDSLNRLTTTTDPMGLTEIYTYDNFGRLLTKTDKNGTITSYTYNVSGKPLKTRGRF